MSAYAAYLRIYEPLAAFPAPERRRWEDYLAAGGAPGRSIGPQLERRTTLAALVTCPAAPVVAEEQEHAFVRSVNGATYVCPCRTQARSWAALAELRHGLPVEVSEAFVPARVADRAQQELARWQAAHPDLRVPVRSNSWQVPLCWFVLVDPDERQLVLDHRLVGGPDGQVTERGVPRSLRYLTEMSRARRRAARALAVLRRTLESGPIVARVEELARWIEEFHPRSIVELDYGGVVQLFDDEALRQDDSAADVAAAITGLAARTPGVTAAAYQRVSARWQAAAMRESAN